MFTASPSPRRDSTCKTCSLDGLEKVCRALFVLKILENLDTEGSAAASVPNGVYTVQVSTSR